MGYDKNQKLLSEFPWFAIYRPKPNRKPKTWIRLDNQEIKWWKDFLIWKRSMMKNLVQTQNRRLHLSEFWRWPLYFGTTPHPVTVTTRIITFLIGNPYKPSFVTVTGWGVDLTYTVNHPYYIFQVDHVCCQAHRQGGNRQHTNIMPCFWPRRLNKNHGTSSDELPSLKLMQRKDHEIQ